MKIPWMKNLEEWTDLSSVKKLIRIAKNKRFKVRKSIRSHIEKDSFLRKN